MNANDIITEDMTLEQKLAAIDAAMRKAQEESDKTRKKAGLPPVPIDPSDATQCFGCS